MDLLYREILTREHSLFKASAVRTIALVLNDIEDLVAVVALGHTGDGLKNELCALKRRTLGDGGNSSSTYCGMTRDNSPTSQTISLMAATLFFLHVVEHGPAHAADNTYLVHGLQPKLFLGKPAERCGSVADGDHERLVIGLVAVVERLFKADRVELALGGAYAAADAQILVDNNAAAAEAALDFLLDLLLGEVAAQIA